MRLVHLYLLVPIAILACVAACSENEKGSSATCDYTPCGGDPTGTWTIGEVCIEIDPDFDDLPECVSVVVDKPRSGGTQIYNADGTYSVEIWAQAGYRLEVPDACAREISGGGGAGGGQEFCDAVSSQAAGGGPTVTCAFKNRVCNCEFKIEATIEETGTWAVQGDRLVLTSDSTGPETGSFCITGNEMTMGDPGNGVYYLTR